MDSDARNLPQPRQDQSWSFLPESQFWVRCSSRRMAARLKLISCLPVGRVEQDANGVGGGAETDVGPHSKAEEFGLAAAQTADVAVVRVTQIARGDIGVFFRRALLFPIPWRPRRDRPQKRIPRRCFRSDHRSGDATVVALTSRFQLFSILRVSKWIFSSSPSSHCRQRADLGITLRSMRLGRCCFPLARAVTRGWQRLRPLPIRTGRC